MLSASKLIVRSFSAGLLFIRKKVRALQCLKCFHTAGRTLKGIEVVNMMRKAQVKRIGGRDARGKATFVASVFRVAA